MMKTEGIKDILIKMEKSMEQEDIYQNKIAIYMKAIIKMIVNMVMEDKFMRVDKYAQDLFIIHNEFCKI